MYCFRKYFLSHRKTIYLLSSATMINSSDTKTTHELKSTTVDGTTENTSAETGWDRLAVMFSQNEFGEVSKELGAVINASTMAFLMGSAFGICKNTREAHRNFIEKNQASQFSSSFEAKKKLQDRVMIAAFKGWFQYGLKLGSFCSFMLLGTTCLMVYSGSSSVFHYGLIGSMFGTVYRWKLGPRGMYVGGILGGTLGLCAGLSTKGLLFLFDSSMDDLIVANAEQYLSRKRQDGKQFKRSIDEESSISSVKLIDEHAARVFSLEENEKQDVDKK